jgi:hypothetical protein
MTMKTPEVLRALAALHPPNKWAFFDELRIGTGFSKDSEQRFDAWAIHYHPSKRNVTRCYEIKVSRGDFFNEIRKPYKRRPGLRLANEFWFVAPAELLKIEEVPPECGLMEVDEDHNVNVVLKAPYRDVLPPTWLFVASICRRFDKERLAQWLAMMKSQQENETYGVAIVQALQIHIDRWKNFQDGNKEVPDMIADALEQVYYDAMDILEKNRKVK